MQKVDLKAQYKALYAPSAKVVAAVTVPAWQFLLVDGTGDPNTSERFQQAVETLFALSYALKFLVRAEQAVDYGVMPLEGLWWSDDPSAFSLQAKERWSWTVMIMQPAYVTEELVARARAQVAAKKDLPLLPALRFETYAEGLAAQTLHIGPFSTEEATVVRVHDFIAQAGYRPEGKHHEIYLSDIRRAAPERWKTVVRQPMR
ncbi:MAG TPA: GyrI-like domain-containing protein [Armatimonadota bacterium]|jgi:hypothetical protein